MIEIIKTIQSLTIDQWAIVGLFALVGFFATTIWMLISKKQSSYYAINDSNNNLDHWKSTLDAIDCDDTRTVSNKYSGTTRLKL